MSKSHESLCIALHRRALLRPLLQWKSSKCYTLWMYVCVCVCNLSYLARNAHAPYCHLWPAPLYNIFSTLSHKRHDFRKKVTEHKMCFLIFSTTSVWNIYHYKKNRSRLDPIRIFISIQGTFYSCRILIKLEFFCRFSDNKKIKLHENPSTGRPFVPSGWADGRIGEDNRSFLKFWERAWIE